MVVTDEIEYLSAINEANHVIAQASATLDDGTACRRADCRTAHERIHREAATEVDYMDVSPQAGRFHAAALIPFLEHDDANRALMGSNMQRQAVPTLRSGEAAGRHGHGAFVARLRRLRRRRRGGVIDSVDASRIVVRVDETERAG
jgi:DNA-directed RNA polymerase subunit beta